MSAFLHVTLWAAALAFLGGAHAAELTPSEIVNELYRLELGPKGDMATPPVYSFTDAPIQRRLTRGFQRLVAKMVADETKTNQAILDWDPIADGNGAVPLGVKVDAPPATGGKAEIVARFHIAGGERKAVTYRFVREDGVWKIDDILVKSEDIRIDIQRGLDAK
jgi:hypothetical protein